MTLVHDLPQITLLPGSLYPSISIELVVRMNIPLLFASGCNLPIAEPLHFG